MQYPITVNNTASKFLFALLLGLAALPVQAKIYKWVDAQGNVHYSDPLPPSAAPQGNAEISKSGNVVKKTESVEEKNKRLAAEAEAAQRKKVAAEQARKDRALLATYTSEQEIDLSRDRALENHNLIIKSAQSRLSQLEPRTMEIRNKIKTSTQSGKPAPAYLKQQYTAVTAEIEDTKRTIKTNEEAMAAVRARYDADKQRFRELTVKP